MMKQEHNVAYIDGANLHEGIRALGWRLDYHRFRVWLRERYGVERAYLFIGFIPRYKDLYLSLQKAGYTLVYKEISYDGDGRIKGNCDADLVLKTAIDFYEKKFDRAVLVSSDGDYAGLVQFLKSKGVFHSLISPRKHCSFLLRKQNIQIVYIDAQRKGLEKYA